MDTLSKSDFPEIISDKFLGESPLTSGQAGEVIISNFEKGKITEEIFLNGLNVLDKLEKGKRGVLGEIRTWSGKKYQKTANGWQPVKEGGSFPAKTESKDPFKDSSEGELNKMAGNPNDPLSEHAKLELNKRNKSKGMELRFKDSEIDKNKLGQEKDHFEANEKYGKKESSTETKVSDFGIAGKVGGGYRATGTIDGKKMGVDIPGEMIRGVANFDGKELRQKIKAHLVEKGEEITTGKKGESSEGSEKTPSK